MGGPACVVAGGGCGCRLLLRVPSWGGLWQGKELSCLQTTDESSSFEQLRGCEGKYSHPDTILTRYHVNQGVSVQSVEVPHINTDTQILIEVRAASLDPVDLKVRFQRIHVNI